MSRLKVVLVTGISGSGKSEEVARLAKEDPKHTVVIAVNDYFVEYDDKFHYAHLVYPYAQDDAKGKFAYALMRAGQDETKVVIVEDIFSTVGELNDYMIVARSYDCEVEIVTMECDPATAIARQVHGMRPGYIVSRDRDLRARVIPEAWKVTQRTVKVPPIVYPVPIE
jgi:tRNA uridine 5-carbamoylmethylation protein Kti12